MAIYRVIRCAALFALSAALLIGVGGESLAQSATPTRTPIAPAANVCSALVRAAMESTNQECGDTSRNQACYGHVLNQASFRSGSNLVFESQGDKASLDQIQTLDLSPLDLELEQWGVVLMQAQANLPDQLPGQNVTFILFGDVELNNAAGELVKLEARLTETAPVRIAPGESRAVIATLTQDVALFATGKYFNADGVLWVRVAQALDASAFGWVPADVIDTELSALPDVSPTGEVFNPMQAFYFKTGIGQPQCVEAPRDGMLVQTPRGVGKVNFTINGIDVALGSTAYITSPEEDQTCLSLLTGEVDLDSAGERKTLHPGQRSCVPLNENGIADGPPSEPDSFDPAEIALLKVVLDVLPETVDIPDPAPSNTPTNTNTPLPPRPTATATATPTDTPEPPPAATSAPPTATNTPKPTRTPTSAFTPTDTLTPTVTPTDEIVQPPVAAFSYSVAGMIVQTADMSSNSPTQWTWTFSEGVQSVGSPTAFHVYNYPGYDGVTDRMITLEVCNAGGCDTTEQMFSLPNCNYDTGVVHTPSWTVAADFVPGDAYNIFAKNEYCEYTTIVGTVSEANPTVVTTAYDGQHFVAESVSDESFCVSVVVYGSGTISVGGSVCP